MTVSIFVCVNPFPRTYSICTPVEDPNSWIDPIHLISSGFWLGCIEKHNGDCFFVPSTLICSTCVSKCVELRSYWKWPFIVHLLSKNGGSFHSFLYVYQRVAHSWLEFSQLQRATSRYCSMLNSLSIKSPLRILFWCKIIFIPPVCRHQSRFNT